MFSPFVASLANLSGYFDQLLVLATLGAVMLVATERPLWAGLVCVLAVLSHEMFALFGLPVVATGHSAGGHPASVQPLRTSRQFDHAQLWRHRAGAGDHPPPGRSDGWEGRT